MIPGADPTDREVHASAGEMPEHMVVLLLEAGQRFLGKAEEAIKQQEPTLRDLYLRRTLSILLELSRRLNPEEGGELVVSLINLYDWWGREVMEGGEQPDTQRLRRVSSQMGEIRRAWEQVLFKGQGMSELPEI